MSLVTTGDQAKALVMVGSGSRAQDRLLLSLANKLSWTPAQRKLIGRMWMEREQRQRMGREQRPIHYVGAQD